MFFSTCCSSRSVCFKVHMLQVPSASKIKNMDWIFSDVGVLYTNQWDGYRHTEGALSTLHYEVKGN